MYKKREKFDCKGEKSCDDCIKECEDKYEDDEDELKDCQEKCDDVDTNNGTGSSEPDQ